MTSYYDHYADELIDQAKEATLLGDMVVALFQYRDDLRHPPQADSIPRRLAMIEALIARSHKARKP